MSKSKGNEIVVSELFKRHQPETLRFFLLATHYRRPIDYSEERLEEIRRGLDGFYRFFERFERITGKSFYSSPPAAGLRGGPAEASGGGRRPAQAVPGAHGRRFQHRRRDRHPVRTADALNRFADARQLEAGKGTSGRCASVRARRAVLKELSQISACSRQPPARSRKAATTSSGQRLDAAADRSACRSAQGEELRPGRSDSQAA